MRERERERQRERQRETIFRVQEGCEWQKQEMRINEPICFCFSQTSLLVIIVVVWMIMAPLEAHIVQYLVPSWWNGLREDYKGWPCWRR